MALQTRCISHVAELAGSTCVAVAVPNDADWVADHDQSRTRHGNIRTEASRYGGHVFLPPRTSDRPAQPGESVNMNF